MGGEPVSEGRVWHWYDSDQARGFRPITADTPHSKNCPGCEIEQLRAALRSERERADGYRIEADCAMRDFDGLEVAIGEAIEFLAAPNAAPKVQEALAVLRSAHEPEVAESELNAFWNREVWPLKEERDAALSRAEAAERALALAEERERELREALQAEHEDRCGCPRPGDIAYCVAGQNFSALTETSGSEEGA